MRISFEHLEEQEKLTDFRLLTEPFCFIRLGCNSHYSIFQYLFAQTSIKISMNARNNGRYTVPSDEDIEPNSDDLVLKNFLNI